MDYNEQQAAQRRADAASRKKFLDGLSGAQDKQRTAQLKAAAERLDAAEHARKIKEADEQIAAHEAALKDALKAAYAAAQGGNLAGFEQSYPRLRAAWVEAETLRTVATLAPASPGQVAVEKMLVLHYGKK